MSFFGDNNPTFKPSKRIINEWEHVTPGSDIVTVVSSTLSASGNLAILPLVADEVRHDTGSVIQRFYFVTVTPGVGTAFTATLRYVESFSKALGVPTEIESNQLWTDKFQQSIEERDREYKRR